MQASNTLGLDMAADTNETRSFDEVWNAHGGTSINLDTLFNLRSLDDIFLENRLSYSGIILTGHHADDYLHGPSITDILPPPSRS